MSNSPAKYLGVQEHKMDPKFRVSIPSFWRPVEGEELILRNLTHTAFPFIQVLNNEALAKVLETINNTSTTSGNIAKALDVLYSSLHSVNLSNQGKLQLPREWCLKANLPAESKVILRGTGHSFSIFHPTVFADLESKQYSEVSDDLAETGIFPK